MHYNYVCTFLLWTISRNNLVVKHLLGWRGACLPGKFWISEVRKGYFLRLHGETRAKRTTKNCVIRGEFFYAEIRIFINFNLISLHIWTENLAQYICRQYLQKNNPGKYYHLFGSDTLL